MAASVVQSKSAAQDTGLATVAATFNSAATAGNLLLLTVGADDYAAAPPSGWTQSTGTSQQTFLGHYLWWKVAAGGETSVSYTIGSASPSCWVTAEVSGLTASPYNTSNGQLTASATASYTTPSITPTAGDRFLVGTIGFSCHSSNSFTGIDTWLNSFTETGEAFTSTVGVTHDLIGLAYRSVTADGVTGYSTGATSVMPSSTPQTSTGIIAAFNVAPPVSSWTYGYDVRIG